MKHARLSPSSAHRWMNCPGSVYLTATTAGQGLPEIGTEYQREGSAAHKLAEVWLKQGEHVALNLEQVYVDGVAMPVTDEMREGVRLFVETVNAIEGGRRYVESTFDLAVLHPPEPMFGTADVVIIKARTLYVFDLKFGQGVLVEVKDNPQLLYYAVGAALAELMRRLFEGVAEASSDVLQSALCLFDKIVITIVQPRAAHRDGQVRSLELEPDALQAFSETLLDRARDAHTPGARLVPGEWCRFCPAQGHCPALAEHAKLVAQMDFDAVPVDTPPAPELLPIEVCSNLLSKVQVLENWFNALRARITHELEAGRDVPGWKLVTKRARRVWCDPKEVEKWAALSGLTPSDFYEPLVLKSPAQLEKVVGKKHLPEELYARVSSGLTLAPEHDPRPAAAIGPQEEFAALPPASVEADLVVEE